MGGRMFVIIGAGPTGLGAAWRRGAWCAPVPPKPRRSLLLSAAASFVDEKGFVWDLGGHVVFSHYEYFDKLLDFLLDNNWVDHVREAWVWMRERFIPYPFQNNIWRLPEGDLIACLEGLLEVHSVSSRRCPRFWRVAVAKLRPRVGGSVHVSIQLQSVGI